MNNGLFWFCPSTSTVTLCFGSTFRPPLFLRRKSFSHCMHCSVLHSCPFVARRRRRQRSWNLIIHVARPSVCIFSRTGEPLVLFGFPDSVSVRRIPVQFFAERLSSASGLEGRPVHLPVQADFENIGYYKR